MAQDVFAERLLSTCLGANALVQLFNDAAYPGVVGARRHAEAGEGS